MAEEYERREGLHGYKVEGGREDSSEVGLADNNGIAFQCGACMYYLNGVCHNKNPKIHHRPVQAAWCCNLYDHAGMHVIV